MACLDVTVVEREQCDRLGTTAIVVNDEQNYYRQVRAFCS